MVKKLLPVVTALLGLAQPSAHAVEALLTEDSTVFSASSAATNGTATTQVVNTTTAKCAILRFEIASMLPPGTTADSVATATLRLFSTVAPTGTGSVAVHTILPARVWTEATATGAWVAGVDYTTTPLLAAVAVSNFSLNDYTALDVTSAVKGWITTPSSNNGLILRPNGTIGLTFATKENTTGGRDAVLEITLLTRRVNPAGDVSMGQFTLGVRP